MSLKLSIKTITIVKKKKIAKVVNHLIKPNKTSKSMINYLIIQKYKTLIDERKVELQEQSKKKEFKSIRILSKFNQSMYKIFKDYNFNKIN